MNLRPRRVTCPKHLKIAPAAEEAANYIKCPIIAIIAPRLVNITDCTDRVRARGLPYNVTF